MIKNVILELLLNYDDLRNKGYNKVFRSKFKFNAISALFPIFNDCNSINLSMNTLKQSNNFTYIVVGLITCVAVYYFKIYL